MTTEQMIEVMTAHTKGATIEWSRWDGNDWSAAHSPNWNWAHCRYRIKPEPKLVRIPKSLESLPPVFWIRNTASPTSHYLVTSINGTTLVMYNTQWELEVCHTSSDREYSADRKVWHKFYKEVPQ